MKISNLIIIAVLTILCVGSWGARFVSMASNSAAYAQNLEEARDYKEKGLYQKALVNYRNAYVLKESSELWEEVRVCLLDAINDGVASNSEYVDMLESAVKKNRHNVALWEMLLQTYMELGYNDQAYKQIQSADRLKIHSDVIEEIRAKLEREFTVKGGVRIFVDSPYGRVTASDGTLWVVLDAGGMTSTRVEGVYNYISPVSVSGAFVYVGSTDTRVVDAEGMVEAILPPEISIPQSRAYSSNRLPIRTQIGWRYLDCAAKTMLDGVYNDVTSYVNGVAAVQKEEGGTWILIDVNGNPISDAAFEEVLMEENGECCFKNIMLAKQNGTWGIYDGVGTLLATVPGVAVDHYRGDYIAYQDANGLWGYIDTAGAVYIQPTYLGAKSFAYGKAAISNGETWGFIDTTATQIIDCQFLDGRYFISQREALVSTKDDLYSVLSMVR